MGWLTGDAYAYDGCWLGTDHHQHPPQFPAELESQILHLVHHHVSSLDQLVNKVYDALKPVAPAESPAAQGKENEQAAEAPAAPAQVSAPAAKGPKAPKHPLNKQLTRCWIIEVCFCIICLRCSVYYLIALHTNTTTI